MSEHQPEDLGAYDNAGNYIGEIEMPKPRAEFPDPWPSKEAEAKFDAEMRQIEAEAKRRRDKLKYPIQLLHELTVKPKPKDWIVKGLLARGETSAWIAPPGGMKSALMAELCVCVANQQPWHGRKVYHCDPVLYFALERADLVQRRLAAHCERLGYTEEHTGDMAIAICRSTIDLTNEACIKDIGETIRVFRDNYGIPPRLLIFDTFAKLIAAGGKDENSAKDQGAVFANVQRIKDENGNPHVALIGHTGKDESRGARGSNAILGDVDVMVEISGDTVKTATVTKANDLAEGPLFSFKSETHQFGLDDDGEPFTVNIVSSEDLSVQVAPKAEKRLTEMQEAMYRLLRDAGAAGLSTEDWNAKAREHGMGNRRASLVNVKAQLRDKGLVREYAGIWKVNNG
ncbi:AAA family ATPase [Bradyrhizobium yuanmingense]|uniref:AAA family ATPase n=1 Tax=Bradyrhizobium yuanmingense TaxID=108015 RepID=UPI0012F949D8|nr:AAA family ATPase [Bradyrhizobium yuanmingense]MVT52107.1 AAA family ATPase [Bradyrhizobium yuanmingense]